MRVRVIREFNLGGRIYTPGAFPYLRVDDDLGAQLLERGLAEVDECRSMEIERG